MRIVSKQRDFYDCIQATGQDRSLNYVREPKEITLKKWRFPECGASYFGNSQGATGKELVIGFCGKIYPVVRLPIKYDEQMRMQYAYCYTVEDVDEYVLNYCDKAKANRYYEKKPKRPWTYGGGIFGHGNFHRYTFEEYFKRCKDEQDKHKNLFEENHAPIFVAFLDSCRLIDGYYCSKYVVVFNVLLNQFDFQRVFDPYQAYQELYMYLANQAVPQKPMPVISDEMKIATHGFNSESFRRPKGGQ